jgi:thiamine pyridinylase
VLTSGCIHGFIGMAPPTGVLTMCIYSWRVVRFAFLILSVLILSARVCVAGMDQDCQIGPPQQPVEPITLRVALYPFVPDRLELFEKIEAIFECENPGVNVVLISSPNAGDNYYDDDNEKKKGIQFVNADVYEIDTVLLSDFVALGKIVPIELPFDDFAPETLRAVTRNSMVYGVPHWLCGNFLFYRKSDAKIRDATTWKDVISTLATRNQALLVDFKGRSTLGEWYFTTLSSAVGSSAAESQITGESPIDASAISYKGAIERRHQIVVRPRKRPQLQNVRDEVIACLVDLGL